MVKSNKERNLIVYPFQHNDDDGQDKGDGQTESWKLFTVKTSQSLPRIKLLKELGFNILVGLYDSAKFSSIDCNVWTDVES